ncbi:hypothetical protein [Sulfobacillus thermosulfidooxidans]|uniref:hypothetical protein n=1 Tax=Sulfobacillus thermosulfidooxidans TaxID=28034 RepID=UPI0003F8F45C|nr:hypothetical protein [Sulfobacillus thermosulfidooxidans]
MNSWQNTEKIADAVLYEGYALYPYRPSAIKNQQRWTFGRIVPEFYHQKTQSTDPWFRRAQTLLQASSLAITLRLRFLQIAEPPLSPDSPSLSWQQALPRDFSWTITSLPWDKTIEIPAHLEDAGEVKNIVFHVEMRGNLFISEPEPVWLLTTTIKNVTPDISGFDEASALRHSLIATHWLLSTETGKWVSLLDPPSSFEDQVATLTQDGVWPVLAGDEQDGKICLVSPIILYDYPTVADNSPGDFFDGAEIDEMLTLRILTLTDAEKEEAMRADPKVQALLERTQNLSRDDLYQLHGMAYRVSPHSSTLPHKEEDGTHDKEDSHYE